MLPGEDLASGDICYGQQTKNSQTEEGEARAGNRKEETEGSDSESQSHVDAGPEETGVKERPEAGAGVLCTKTRGWKKEQVPAEERRGRDERALRCRSGHGNAEKASLGGALGCGHRQDELWEGRGDESKKEVWRKLVAPSDVGGALRTVGLEGPLADFFISDGLVSKGACGYLHDADVICAVQLALLDHLLLESGQVPLQVFPLTGVLLLQV